MTLLEAPPSDSGPDDARSTASAVLIVDGPNIDATIGNAILGGRKPGPSERPRFAALRSWFIGSDDDSHCAATLFTNLPATRHARLSRLSWLQSLKRQGYSVFAKPKMQDDDDIDADMLRFLHGCHAAGRLERLVVCSGDARLLLQPLRVLAQQGVAVTVAALFESAGRLACDDAITFVDLEEIPGVFPSPLPNRVRLLDVPPVGAWL